jgi:hypothetical protein
MHLSVLSCSCKQAELFTFFVLFSFFSYLIGTAHNCRRFLGETSTENSDVLVMYPTEMIGEKLKRGSTG